MKLSNVKGDRVFDVIADIIPPIANIAEDKTASELFVRKKLPKGMTPKGFMLKRMKAAVPQLLKGHKADMIAILSSIEGVSASDYEANLDLLKLINDCVELITDEAFNALFISAQTGDDSSGSAPENTEALEA